MTHHYSDCALHNGPAYPAGPCDCGFAERRIAELEAALSSLRLTACVLLQNAEGCAVNHYGVDFHLHGEPGWLRDCRRTIEAAESALGVHTLPVDQAK